MVPFHTVALLFLIYSKIFQVPAGYTLCGMFIFPCLDVLRGVKKALALLKIFRFDPGSFIKLLSIKIKKKCFSKIWYNFTSNYKLMLLLFNFDLFLNLGFYYI